MKAKILLIAVAALAITSCQAQAGATVYAKNSDISDNLDLRAVASIFGESSNLQDFERRLNEPEYQISNLDLNGDNQVDYLRVIESVEDRTHVVIIQAVLDRDVYQDVATIDVERDNYNKVNVQVVGNTYLYGDNYIYEPVYSVVPVIYTSFWVTNYRPYISSWGWNYYPTYYTAWRPYPVYRYRSNINININVNNHYNYVSTRRSYRAPAIYQSRRSYGYERMSPNNSFAQRHANVNNRYELDQRRVASRETNRNSYNTNGSRPNSGRMSTSGGDNNRYSNRNYAENRTNSDRTNNTNRPGSSNDNTVRGNNPVRVDNTPRTNNNTNPSRGYSENRMNTDRTSSTPRAEAPRASSQNSMNTNRPAPVQRTEAPSRSYSENRSYSGNTARQQQSAPQQSAPQRNAAPQQSAPQRSEAPRASQESRQSQPQRESGSGSRGGNGGGRRG